MIATPVAELPDRSDVIVIGSGAAGLTAAVRAADSGATVTVLEKAALFGGTTAVGGGVIWAPANPLSGAAGYDDSPAQASSYLAAAADRLTPEEVAWFVASAPRAVEYLQSSTRVSLVPLARPDYRLEWEGATEGGRSLDNAEFDVGAVPGLREAIRPSSYFPLLTMAERDELNGQVPDAALLQRRAADGVRTMGGALVASLLVSALDRGVTVAAGARVTGLEREADDGWLLTVDGRELRARSVVIASGGFEWSPELQAAFLPHPIVPISAPSNEGDGLRLGLAAGAAVAEMTTFWGVPVITPPSQTLEGKQSGRMGNVEMTLPGSITVSASGRRFVNEALNYHDVSRVFGGIDPRRLSAVGEPAWLVFDQRYRDNYPVAGIASDTGVDWIVSAPTPEQLAELIGVDPQGLAEQIAEFNTDAALGVDTAFGRGDTPQDRFLGDGRVTPNPCLRPLDTAPFYAVRVHCGTLGTSGGIATDTAGRVLGHDGRAIPGLFAAGNASASVFRGAYPGGGATLGSAVVRAFCVGEQLANDHSRVAADSDATPASPVKPASTVNPATL